LAIWCLGSGDSLEVVAWNLVLLWMLVLGIGASLDVGAWNWCFSGGRCLEFGASLDVGAWNLVIQSSSFASAYTAGIDKRRLYGINRSVAA
jgi:hypothetical protein